MGEAYNLADAVREHEDARCYRAAFPGESDPSILVASGPEEIEEEGCAEDEGDEHAGEDVVAGHADVAVIVLDGSGVML